MNACNSDQFFQKMTEKFSGFDAGDPGTPDKPSIWLMGIEPGWPKGEELCGVASTPYAYNDYTIEMQMRWRYNQQAFKLLAAIDGHSEWKKFACDKKPFEKGSLGYFKGNIYPLACPTTKDWPSIYKKASGLESKEEYRDWCKTNRHPKIISWISECKPRLIIGVGIGDRDEFSNLIENSSDLQEHRFTENPPKRLFVKKGESTSLVVLPHFTGGRNGLNSDKSIREAAQIIKREILSNPTFPEN